MLKINTNIVPIIYADDAAYNNNPAPYGDPGLGDIMC